MKNIRKMKFRRLKLVFAVMLLLFVTGNVFPQENKGTIKGKVVFEDSKLPVEFANIQVYGNGDSTLINGTLTDEKGEFLLKNMQKGIFEIKISFIGYSTEFIKDVEVSKTIRDLDIGVIKLRESPEMTSEIVVEDEARIMTIEAGKMVYDTKREISSQSGNVLDLLKNIPSVTVDNDGNVSLRGSDNVKILINNRPSALLSNGTQVLQNMPSSEIDRIEIINNPSAKYEAEGISGIINIIMKTKPSYSNGNWNSKIGAGTEDKYNISTIFSLSKNKFTLNGNYSYFDYTLPGTTTFERENYSSISSRYVKQFQTWKYLGLSHLGSLGLDYELDEYNTLSLVSSIFYYERNYSIKNNIDFYDVNNNFSSNYNNENYDPRSGLNYEVTLSYLKKFENDKGEINSFVNFSKRDEKVETKYNNFEMNGISKQVKNAVNNFNFINFQSDYVRNFEDSKLEAGIKSNVRFINGNYSYSYLDNNSNQWYPIAGRDNNFDYTDIISATYIEYSGDYKKLEYKGGLRAEQTNVKFLLKNETETYTKNYLDIFPSLSLTLKLDLSNQFQASYSRRINRPVVFLLNPFVEQFDDYTKRSGNLYLTPEYINSFELGYTKYFDFGIFTLTGFYRNVNDPINFVTTVDTSGASFMKPENIGTSKTFGLEFINQGNITKWWNYNGSFTYFSTRIEGSNMNINIDKNYSSWAARLSTSFSLKNLFDTQLSYFYYGKQIMATGEIEPSQILNLSIQKNLFGDRLMLNFKINDIFNQQKFTMETTGSNYQQTVYQRPGSRTAFLSLVYNFGNNKQSITSKKIERKQKETEAELQDGK